MRPKLTILIVLACLAVFQNLHAQTWVKSGPAVFDKTALAKLTGETEKYVTWESEKPVNKLLADAYRDSEGNLLVNFPVDYNGETERFHLFPVSYMEENLARRYPQIKTFKGYSKTGKALSLLITPYYSEVNIWRLNGDVFRIRSFDGRNWVAYDIRDVFSQDITYECNVSGSDSGDSGDNLTGGENRSAALQRSVTMWDDSLRIFRYAVLPNWGYAVYYWDHYDIDTTVASDNAKRTAVLAGILQTLQMVNGTFERDVNIRFVLTDREDSLIPVRQNMACVDTASMPDVQHFIDSVIGSSSYDLGMFWKYSNSNFGGITSTYTVCNSTKAFGNVSYNHPDQILYPIFVLHETGHKFGGEHPHTICGYFLLFIEPGTGYSLISYAGRNACGAEHSYLRYPYFRFDAQAIQTIKDYAHSMSCPQKQYTGNHKPVLTVGPDRYIPRKTPFVLPVHATDPDGDRITYVWEEMDAATHPVAWPDSKMVRGSLFRSFAAREEPVRYFPRIDSLAEGIFSTKWEVLPDTSRILTFAVTARDNRYDGGLVDMDSITLTVDYNSGPFRVTSLATPETWTPGSSVTITWDPAGTDNPLNPTYAPFVDIIGSKDGGFHYTDTLASHVPNNGSYTITAPMERFYRYKIMVKPENQYYFSVSKSYARIGNFVEDCTLHYESHPNAPIPDADYRGVTDTIAVMDIDYITKVMAYVDVSHECLTDLEIKLKDPHQNEIFLWKRHCDCGGHPGDGDIRSYFSDDGSNIPCAYVATGDTIKPAWYTLAVFNNKPALGNWVMTVADRDYSNTGQFNEWRLYFCVMRPVMGTEKYMLDNVTIFPNPASGELNIVFPLKNAEDIEVMLFDISGRLVFANTYEASGSKFKGRIPLGKLDKGIYLVKVKQGKYVYTQSVLHK